MITIAILTALAGAAASAVSASRRPAVAPIKVLTRDGEAKARRARAE